jgi:hypothetical protein
MQGTVVHICNLNCLGDRDGEDHSLRPAPGGPEFKPQYCQKIRRKKEKERNSSYYGISFTEYSSI